MEWRPWKSTLAYAGLLAGAWALALAAGWRSPWDNAVYDEVFRRFEPTPWQPQSALLVFDERSLSALPEGRNGLRPALARALRLIAPAHPAAVAVDIILADRGSPSSDADLAEALRGTPNLILSSELLRDGWEDPLPEFRSAAAAIGHVHAQPDAGDAITRAIPLEEHYGTRQLWALSLEAFRMARHAAIVQSTEDLQVGGDVIPAGGSRRLMRVRYPPPSVSIPSVSVKQLFDDPSLARTFAGRVVFAGVTAQTEHDRLFSPYSNGTPTSGIEINAAAFETISQRLFLTNVPDIAVVLIALLLVAAAGLSFRYLPGWAAYVSAFLLIAAATAAPYLFFTARRVLPFTTSFLAAWFGSITAAAYYHLVVRRSLRRSEAERHRYQQAMHFVTHEMRTPLSAIQGSSELISRFALTEEKRKQIALLINSESKRLARMVEIFLNVERLSAGQMELKREPISIKEMVEICVERTLPLAQRKRIEITLEPIGETLQLTGDRELMEYACYNLLTNAVKYSPQRTVVTVNAARAGSHVRIAVKDQGIGMDQKEVKQIFRKFYRTKKAEESGEAGTGIGLSIVQQIVEQHGGEIEVVSEPGAGSCFTLVLPAASAAQVPTAVERH